jgi:hypothetical protein
VASRQYASHLSSARRVRSIWRLKLRKKETDQTPNIVVNLSAGKSGKIVGDYAISFKKGDQILWRGKIAKITNDVQIEGVTCDLLARAAQRKDSFSVPPVTEGIAEKGIHTVRF